MRRSAVAFVLALLPGLPAAALTATEVERQVIAALKAEGLAAPERLGLVRPFPDCDVPLKVSQGPQGWRTVRVACDAPKVWHRQVRIADQPLQPVARSDQSPRPEALRMAMALRRSLPRGAVIGPDDIVLAPVGGSDPAAVFGAPEDVVGRVLKLAVSGGATLLPRHLEPLLQVRKGQVVTIELSAGGVTVAFAGTALEDGVAGQRIDIAGRQPGRVIRAVVAGQDRVRVESNIP